jgi:hypothetical protein
LLACLLIAFSAAIALVAASASSVCVSKNFSYLLDLVLALYYSLVYPISRAKKT